MNNEQNDRKPDLVKPDLRMTWHSMGKDDVLSRLGAHQQEGLTTSEVARRVQIYGRNELKEKPRPSFMQLVIAQLNNFVVILLIVASIISALLGDWVEAGAILLIVVLNAILGVVQESRAEEALAALKKLASPEAQVLRDGSRTSVPASELVPGDIVYLETGNYVPADMRLVDAVNLRIEEAALTGESVPVQKNAALVLDENATIGDRKNTVFMGTVVSYGRGRGVVVSTGMSTQLGLIADMLQSVESEETPLQKRLDQLGKILGWGALAICLVVFLLGMLRTDLFTQGFTLEVRDGLVESFMIAVSLAIAAVPEGLPAVVTISLALGMREMVRRHALIRRLASVETLGSATVICSDKTGTLTQNVMTVTQLWVDGKLIQISGNGYEAEGQFEIDGQPADFNQYPAMTTALWIGVLNNDALLEKVEINGKSAFRIIGDPTEGSILVAAAKAGIFQDALNQAYPREQEIPFDSARKRMVTIHDVMTPRPEDSSPFYDESRLHWKSVAVKGAPDVVLRSCTHYQTADDRIDVLDERMRQGILAANDTMTKDALRVLGLAYNILPHVPGEFRNDEIESDLVFVGLVGMIDPARTEVKPALNKARQQASVRL